jgi:uncharacterized membrane protein YhhN
MTRQQSFFFFIFASLFVLTRFVAPYPFSWLVKIIPLLLLIAVSIPLAKNKSELFFVTGLVCSAFGDFFLDYDRVNWFVFGLAAFLFAHIFYILSFKPFCLTLLKKRLAYIVMYCGYGLVIFITIAPNLGELFIPVLMYMSVLLLMAIATLLCEKSNIWLLLGGASFIISDSILGIDKFYYAIKHASLYIMISYYFAQFALVKGMFYTNKHN